MQDGRLRRFEFRGGPRHYRRPMPWVRLPAALVLPLALAACGLARDAGDLVHEVRDEPLTDRCARVMQEAFPGGGISVSHEEMVPAASTSIATVVVAVEGTRKKLPPESTLTRDVAVECRFTDTILTQFRWTKGPLRSP